MNIESYSDSTGSLRWEGFAIYTSLDGSRWSNQPFTKEQKAYDKLYKLNFKYSESIIKLIEKKCFTLEYINKRISDGTLTLSKKVQKWFVEHYFSEVEGIGRGTFII